MIRSFADKRTAALFSDEPAKGIPSDIRSRARAKLLSLDAANQLNDLRVTPANRLEALKGKRRGQHSIRINDQWRVCFRWHGGDAHDVEIVDYH